MSPEATLRAAIEASLRVRHSTDSVTVDCSMPGCAIASIGDGGTLASTVAHTTELDALAALTLACGLNPDGTDPREELAALRAIIDDAQGHLSSVHALDCEQPDTAVCSNCDVEKARRALAKAGAL